MYPRAPHAGPIGGVGVASGINVNALNHARSQEIRREAAERRARKAANPNIIAKKEAARARNAEKKLLLETKKAAAAAARQDALKRKRLMQLPQNTGLRILEENALHGAGGPGTSPNILPVQVQPNLLDTLIA